MKDAEEIRKAIREKVVPRLAVMLDLADDTIEEWRKARPEGQEIAYTGEISLSERLAIAQMGVSILAQASLEEIRKQGPPGYRVAPPLTEEQARDAEKTIRDAIENAGVPGFMVAEFPSPKQARDAEKELGKALETASVTKEQWDAITEFFQTNEHAIVVIQLIMAGKQN